MSGPHRFQGTRALCQRVGLLLLLGVVGFGLGVEVVEIGRAARAMGDSSRWAAQKGPEPARAAAVEPAKAPVAKAPVAATPSQVAPAPAAPLAAAPAKPAPPAVVLELAPAPTVAALTATPMQTPAPLVAGPALAPAPSPQPAPASTPAPAIDPRTGHRTASGVLASGDSLAAALAEQGVAPVTVHLLSKEMARIFDFRDARPGHRFRLVQDVAAQILDFEYVAGDESYHLSRRNGAYVAERRAPEVVHQKARIAGVVSTSLYEAIRSLGESPQLASDFAELFAWDVDFSKHVRPGDRFSILYERLYRRQSDGRKEYAGPGMILAARYEGETGEHTAVYFENRDSRGGYFRPDGSSVRRQFLAAPLKYSRIASSFTNRRLHPILRVVRPHHGIDYAAPAGTPIFAVADGQVVYRSYQKGFGNLVKVKHAQGYVSYYAHMSRFGEGLKVGQRVHQKQVLGYVGSTGLATGPHVCFRVAKDGRFVNPLTLRIPAGEPIPGKRLPDFQVARDSLLAQLDGNKLVVTDEAL